MNLPITKEWFEERAAAEGNLEISAGRRLTKTINLTAEELAESETMLFDALPKSVQQEMTELREQLARFRSERAYVVGHNDGWRAAIEAAALIVERNQIVKTPTGSAVEPRWDGNRAGLAYAAAIRAALTTIGGDK